MDISNSKELKIKYEALIMFTSLLQKGMVKPDKKEMVSEKIIDLKREIRRYVHTPTNSFIVKNEGIDGYVILINLPDYVKSEVDAEEYFYENIYIPSPYSAYDCTGRPFTCWHKIVKRRGKYFVYHSISFDF